MDAREVRSREAEQRLWGSLGVSPVEPRLPLERVGSTVRVQEILPGIGHAPRMDATQLVAELVKERLEGGRIAWRA